MMKIMVHFLNASPVHFVEFETPGITECKKRLYNLGCIQRWQRPGSRDPGHIPKVLGGEQTPVLARYPPPSPLSVSCTPGKSVRTFQTHHSLHFVSH